MELAVRAQSVDWRGYPLVRRVLARARNPN
jgi:hypothetical protein